MSKPKKLVLILVYFLSPVIPAVLFILNYPNSSTNTISFLRYIIATIGIFAYVWLTYSFILMARPKYLDRLFGMEYVRKFHKNMSIISMTFALVHGLISILVFSAQKLYERAFITGVLGFIFMLILMVMGGLFLTETLWAKIKGFRGVRARLAKKYRLHLSIHNLTILGTFTLLAHLMLANSTTYSIELRLIYLTHFFLAFSFWFFHKCIRPISIRRHSYIISEIHKENEEVWTLKLVSKGNKKFLKYRQGQYCYLTISSLGMEAHPFSFASSPLNRENIILSIKNVGDYTSNLDKVNVGDIAYLDGPYGNFNYIEKRGTELVFIAGGVGITPFLSMLNHLKNIEKNRIVSLIWGVRTKKDMIFKSELEGITQEMDNFSIAYILSDDDSWTKDCGFIDREILEKYGSCEDPDIEEQNKHYLVCGPKPMTELVQKTLKEMRVAKSNIHIEQFTF
ncbi:MAG: FAD-binding oxidoreductase [Promethearchaeota archaeon]